VFRIERDFTNESGYKSRSTGFGLRMAYSLTENLSQSWRYRLSYDEVFDVALNASPIIQAQPSNQLTSLVGTELLYDRRDDRQDPTDGYYIRLGVDFAGVGGETRFLRTRIGMGYYYPFWDGWVASVSGEGGIIRGLGQEVLIQNRYFVGGDNLRGFETSGIGPRDALTGNALGGNRYAIGTVELQFPTPLPSEFGLRGLLFTDLGYLTDVDNNIPGVVIQDSSRIRVAAGVGINWRSPFGPVRVSIARAVVKESFDRTETFRFGFGSRF
jgi:outer membrane protein insertion porin family